MVKDTELGAGTRIEIEKRSDEKYILSLRDSQDQWSVKMTKEQAEEIGAGLMQLLVTGKAP